jgi:membrane protein YdbS with pleckstrin-like domain
MAMTVRNMTFDCADARALGEFWAALTGWVVFYDDDPEVLVGLVAVAHVVLMPRIRYRVHRWEVTDTAVHTRAGWLGRETRIAPISRVQTVDSRQGALQRAFGLASITVTTASAAGPITVDCLDARTARHVVARLTAITSATEGDAT